MKKIFKSNILKEKQTVIEEQYKKNWKKLS